MVQPSTNTGRRRLAILRIINSAPPGIIVEDIAKRMILCGATIRLHLKALESLNLVTRANYRRWHLADGVNLTSLDGSRLDPGGSNASHR
jgi:DNA-binding IclR family transcriptional regulator